MATIEIKYSIGDKVWSFGVEYAPKLFQCPDCLGTKKWTIIFADGHSEETKCFTCSRSWEGSLGYIDYREWQPTVRQLTIGQFYGFRDGKTQYMCEETGVGSGTIHNEDTLFPTETEAREAVGKEFQRRMAYIAENNFPKKGSFAKALERDIFGFCRYDAIKKEKEMRRWIELITQNEAKHD